MNPKAMNDLITAAVQAAAYTRGLDADPREVTRASMVGGAIGLAVVLYTHEAEFDDAMRYLDSRDEPTATAAAAALESIARELRHYRGEVGYGEMARRVAALQAGGK